MYKYVALILFFVLPQLEVVAQDRNGITGIRDTSYNLPNEYLRNLKKYPFIQLVPDSATANVLEKRNVVYDRIKKRELQLDVFYPSTSLTKKRTAIIFIHGGGWRSGDKTMHHALMQHLAAIGYVGITPEYRLSTEALFPAAVEDIQAAIRWTRKNAAQYNIDPDKIVIAGHSAGGELAAFIGTLEGEYSLTNKKTTSKWSSKANAVIDVDGTLSFVHPESSETKPDQKRTGSALWLGYLPAENPDLFKEASPLSHAGPQCPPYLFINSSVDRMHAGREDFITILNQHAIHSQTKTFADAPHTFCFFRPWFDDIVNTIDHFLIRIFSEQ